MLMNSTTIRSHENNWFPTPIQAFCVPRNYAMPIIEVFVVCVRVCVCVCVCGDNIKIRW